MKQYLNYFYLIIVGLCLWFSSGYGLIAQTLPAEMYLSADGRYLYTGGRASTGLYDSTLIRNIYLNFPQSNYWTLLGQNYQTHTDLLANMTVDGILYDSIGVRFKGQTSYSQVSSQKKSFNISLDFVHNNQDLMGYKTLNLNNSYLDESFIREVFYLHQIRRHIPAAKANYVHLYINNQDWGLYPNVQQINKDFLKEWFLTNNGINWRADKPPGSGGGGPGGGGPNWGDGTAAINYLGADTATYQQYYTLKSTELVNPWDYLVDVCDALNNTTTANLPTILPNYLDIDRTLWFLASEIAFTDDDGYVYKGKMDYYAYLEAETNRLTPLEYDGNTVMDPAHVTWSAFYNATNANYPLLNKILNVPQWRQRYLAHLRTLIETEMNTTACNAIIDNYAAFINAQVQSDPKKIYTYTQFQNEIPILKNFINNRRNNLLANTEVAQVAPTISNVSYSSPNGIWMPPNDLQTANVTAQVTSTSGVYQVQLYYANGLVGNFTALQMFDDGAHNDGASADGVFGGTIPVQAAGSWVRFYVEAIANNTVKSAAYYPAGAEHDVMIYVVPPQTAPSELVINEVMASNTTTISDEAGEYDDWIELYNNSANTLDIGGYYLSDNTVNLDKWQIPAGTTIAPFAYAIFWADEDSSQGPNHLNFKLSASGETLLLMNANLQMIDSVNIGQQTTDLGYARVPNGTGDFVIQSPTFMANNELTAPTNTRAHLKVLLQGAYNPSTGLLNTGLNGIIPNQQPYNRSPWAYAGTETATTINNNICDWVLVEARSTINTAPVERKAALLRNDGVILSPDGTEGVVFNSIAPGNYYLVVRHRNHLAVLSNNAVALPNTTTTALDFTNYSNVYGPNQEALMGDGKYAMFAGDFIANGVVNVLDYNLYISQIGAAPNQYLDGDCNLDKNITTSDYNLYQPNAAIIGVPQIRY